MEGRVHTEIRDDVAYVVLENPLTRNAVSWAQHHRLSVTLQEISGHAGVRFVVLRGADGIFSSGGDLSELLDGLPSDYIADYWKRMAGTVLTLRSMPQVVISAVEGVAIGAGAALALAGDIVVAERTARMRFTFAHLGLMPDAGSSLTLPRLLGPAVARDLLLTGRWIDAQEALDRGMIARVANDGEVDECVGALIEELRQSPAPILSMVKNLVEATAMPEFLGAVRAEGVQQQAAAATGEYRAFLSRVYDGTKSANGRPVS